MVYLLHFDPAFKRIRHWCGSTRDPRVAAALERADASLLNVPIVESARAAGVRVTVTRTWSTVFSTVAELPYPGNRRKLCPTCIASERERRRL